MRRTTTFLAAALLAGAALAAGTAIETQADHQMKAMQDMHQKMMAAKTPQERQALMADHMKAMHGGMSMMCEMGHHGRGGGMHDGMMKRCMSMRDMTMQMMKDREGAMGR